VILRIYVFHSNLELLEDEYIFLFTYFIASSFVGLFIWFSGVFRKKWTSHWSDDSYVW